MDSQWGEWHQGPDWVNGTIPVIATPGNHEYPLDSQTKRIWVTKEGKTINIDIKSYKNDIPGIIILDIEDSEGKAGTIKIKDNGKIITVDKGTELITGFLNQELVG